MENINESAKTPIVPLVTKVKAKTVKKIKPSKVISQLSTKSDLAIGFMEHYSYQETKLKKIKETITKMNFIADLFLGGFVDVDSTNDNTVNGYVEDFYNLRKDLDLLFNAEGQVN